MDAIEITKVNLIERILSHYSDNKLILHTENPIIVDFKELSIRIARGFDGYIIYFYDVKGGSSYKQFDLNVSEFDDIVKKTCKPKQK